MPSERIQRRIESLLDEADNSVGRKDWDAVREACDAVLRLDPDNEEARSYLDASQRDTGILLTSDAVSVASDSGADAGSSAGSSARS